MGLITTVIAGMTLSEVGEKIVGKITNYGIKRFIESKLDNFFDEARKEKNFEKRFMNHDLQKAVVRSYYNSIIKISEDCRRISAQQAGEYKEDLLLINAAVQSINMELKQKLRDVEVDPNPELPISDSYNISDLISHTGNLDIDKKAALKNELVKSALKFELPTILYQELLEKYLFEYMCNFFSLELKENENVYRIFTTQSLAKNEIMLNHINFAVLTTLDNTFETHEDVKKLLDISIEMKAILTNRKNLNTIEFRINNAIHLENIEKLSDNLSKIATYMFSSYSKLKNFLQKMELLEQGHISKEMEEDLLEYDKTFSEKRKRWTPDNSNRLAELVETMLKNPMVKYRMDILDEFPPEINPKTLKEWASKLDKSDKEHYSLEIKHGFGIEINLSPTILKLKQLHTELLQTGGTSYSNAFYRLKNTFNGIEPLGESSTKALENFADEIEKTAITLKNYDENILKALKDILQ